MDAIMQFDSSILLWIQDSLRTDFLSPIVKVITHLGDKGIFWIAVTLALLCFRKTRRLGVMCLVSMVIGLVVTNLVIKNWVARIRPYEVIPGLNCIVGLAKDYSFPSGHTTNSLACAWVLFRRAPKKWGVSALVLAILISLSRLYVGIHYPTDVIGGAVIGICSACLALWLAPKLEKKFPALERLY
ncbi:MAG: phosphatase PAP2 family protein [Clostridia bacterium]|nr:phosphatase PAP2 family protein [Clostridia bacterium]